MKRLWGIAAVLAALTGAGWCDDTAEQAGKPVDQSIQIRQQTQQEIDQWAEQKANLEAEFKALNAERQDLLALQAGLRQRRADLETGNAELETKIAEISRLSDEISPFINEVAERLTACVQNDLPFLEAERADRLLDLRRAVDSTRFSISEKFGKLMAALLAEAEYGNSVEVSHEKIVIEGKALLVQVLRLGRMSLFFETLDHKTTGVFDPSSRQWSMLPAGYNSEIAKAVEMGAKRRSVDLLSLPLGRISVP